MTQDKSFRSAVKAVRIFSSKQMAVTAGFVILVLLGLGACSDNKSKTANNPGSQNSPVATVTPSVAAVSEPAPVIPPKPKNVVHRRPSTATYSDKTYGVSFRYPRKYLLKTGDAVQVEMAGAPVPMNFVQPGGTTLAAVVLPDNSYPGTDFSSAFFNVSVNKGVTLSECGDFMLPTHPDKEPLSPTSIKIGDIGFQEVENATKQSDTKYYHVFQNGACYELAMGLATKDDGGSDGVTPVDREDVFRKLDKIFSTVKIKSEVVPEVAKTSDQATEATNH